MWISYPNTVPRYERKSLTMSNIFLYVMSRKNAYILNTAGTILTVHLIYENQLSTVSKKYASLNFKAVILPFITHIKLNKLA